MSNKNPKSKEPVELRFGVLRPLGNFKGVIEGQNIKYEDLWKHDQYVHDIQFKSIHDEFNDEDNEGQSPTRNLLLKYEALKEKQGHKCYFCGFVDKKYIEIHHKDGNHFNNSEENLETACILCHRQHHLLWLSLCDHAELGAADVDYLPQTELNHLQRISFVMSEHPTRAKDLGRNGKLGTMLSMISNKFSRPLHAFMVSEKVQNDFRDKYIAENDVPSPFTDNSLNYKTLVGAYATLDQRKLDQKAISLLEKLDAFLPRPEQNVKPEEHRAGLRNQIKECITAFEKQITLAFEKEFNENQNVFTIFELAIALKDVDYKVYEGFAPPYLKLIYKPSIFTKEQMEYYKRLGYFNANKWNLNTENSIDAETI